VIIYQQQLNYRPKALSMIGNLLINYIFLGSDGLEW